MSIITNALSWIMNICYTVTHSYGWAIVLFTFCSKIVLLPVSLWTYFNSIKMIKIQPDINFIKVRYYGQKDVIAEEEAKLQKEQGYHPLLSTIPLIIQLVLLMGVVEVIKLGIANPSIDMNFGFINLGQVPSRQGVVLVWSPIVAGLSSWILCVAQNRANVLQSEQSKFNKYGTMAFSVGLSLYLGWFVAIGTALYWVCSNLMAVMQLYILNAIIRPRRYVDYERLEKSRIELAQMQGIGKKQREGFFSENRKRERRDYKRFFSVVNKHLVFYSESRGFYKYYKGFIEYILEHTNITVHYITSDPDDGIFQMEKEQPRIRGYYIGENRLITLMMKMDADVVVMTMPDLDNYHIKRSYVREDVEYVYVPHGMGSHNLLLRPKALDNYDTIYVTGQNQTDEIRETESLFGLKEKNIVEDGYVLIDEIYNQYRDMKHVENVRKKILIAPSWQKDNIVDSCLGDMLDVLRNSQYDVIVRPHPQEVRLKHEHIMAIKEKYECDNITIQTDFSSNNPIFEADLLVTDWSDICWEYTFTTYRPVLFVDTPMKVMNPDYDKIPTVPINILLRDKVGKRIQPDNMAELLQTVDCLIENSAQYMKNNEHLAEEYIFNRGRSAEVGGEYLVSAIQRKVRMRQDSKC